MTIGNLFRPKWKHSDASVRKLAVEKLSDQHILIDVAQNDVESGVRLAAVAKLSDQAQLARIVQGNSDRDVWQAALSKITDEAILAEISRTDQRPEISAAVVKKLTRLLSELLAAAEAGEVPKCARLMGQGIPIDAQDKQGWSALLCAATKRQATAVRWLLEHGAQVNLANSQGSSPLLLAAEKGHEEVVEILLNAGADAGQPNNRDVGAVTPLHCAAGNGYLVVCRQLVAHGAGVEATTVRRATPLHFAAQNGFAEVVEYLLSEGTRALQTDLDGRTPLCLARLRRSASEPDGKVRDYARAVSLLEATVSKSGYGFYDLYESYASPEVLEMLFETTREVVGGRILRVDLKFDDGIDLDGVRIYGERYIELPEERKGYRIRRVEVPFKQKP